MKKYLISFCILISIFISLSCTPDYCPAAQTNLQNLCSKDSVKNKYCCQVVANTSKGKTFAQFCQEVQNYQSALNPLAPQCLSTITDCSQIDHCTTYKD